MDAAAGRWLRNLAFDDPLSRGTFIDCCAAVEGLVQRRLALIGVLEEAAPTSSHAPTVARLRCFQRGSDPITTLRYRYDVQNQKDLA